MLFHDARTPARAVTVSMLLPWIVTSFASANSAPTFSAMPTVSSSTLVADDSTVYTVTTTAADPDGYQQLRTIRVMFDYTETGNDPAKARGYLAWGQSDDDLTKYGGAWTVADATGGGRWGYETVSWGGTNFITPTACQTSVAGAASGGAGTRTVTWSFKVKPAWAANPLMNDVDAFASDGTINLGWLDNSAEFDVVAAPCGTIKPPPPAPLLDVLSFNSLSVALDPGSSPTDVFMIRVTPGNWGGKDYVQADGQLGPAPVWQTKAAWGTAVVTGLDSSTSYAVALRAYSSGGGVCPSTYGPAAQAATGVLEHTINADSDTPISRGIIGNATRLDTFPWGLPIWNRTWEILNNTFARGIAGGLDADTYNWKDMSGQGVGHGATLDPVVPTTLSWMRLARDHSSTPLLTANLRGIGPLASSGYCNFGYTDNSVTTVAQLAADWVRYINFILPNARQGDTLSTSDQAIVDGISWGGQPKLLSPGEAATPRVTYWEIGNEPELALPWCTPGATPYGPKPAEYVDRYKQIAAAMLAVDPAIKVGPCITTASNGQNAHLSALLSDHAARVDFISYHPYGPLYWFAKTYGDTEATAENGLREIQTHQTNARNGIAQAITNGGRNPASIALIASEWNSSDWQWEGSTEIRRVSHGLGVAEEIWTFARLNLLAATYWSWPSWSDGTKTPGYKVFEKMQETLGATLLNELENGGDLRVHSSCSADGGQIAVWMLNLSSDTDKPLRLHLANTGVVLNVSLDRLGNVNGATSLFDRNDPPATAPPLVDWQVQALASQDVSDLTLMLPHSTASLLLVQQRPRAEADFDRDGDVDQDDFGHLQACLSGMTTPQTSPACADARLDGDSDVDSSDLARFMACMQGPGVDVYPGCAQ